MYHLIDYGFIVLHSFIVLFNLFGWIWARLRKWNLALLLLTGLSWFGLGIFFGWGYCPVTDWHFNVLGKLGRYPAESSYIAYLINRLFHIRVDEMLVDKATLFLYLLALAISVFLNMRDKVRR